MDRENVDTDTGSCSTCKVALVLGLPLLAMMWRIKWGRPSDRTCAHALSLAQTAQAGGDLGSPEQVVGCFAIRGAKSVDNHGC